MPTVSKPFAEPEVGPAFFETTNRVDNYQYVGGQIDIHAEDLAGSIPFFPAPNQQDGKAPARESYEVIEEFDGVVRVSLPDETAVPDVIDELVLAGKRVSAHHVYVLAPHTQFGPADAPQNLDPVPQWANDFVANPLAAGRNGPVVVIIDTGILPRGLTSFPMESLLHSDPDVGAPNPGAHGGGVAPYVGHGTFVAGLVLKQSPAARLVVVRPRGLTPTLGQGGLSLTDDELAAALIRSFDIANDFAVPRVLNLSLAGRVHNGFDPSITKSRNALDGWSSADVVVVAAAGNAHSEAKHYPGAYRDVTCVGALNEHGHRATFSNWGDWVDEWQLGVDTESWYVKTGNQWSIEVPAAEPARRNKSAGPWGGFARWSGTSFAAPTVSGLRSL